MRAGKLDRVMEIRRVTTGTSDTGAVTETWNTLATVRAKQVEMSLDTVQRQQGAVTEDVTTYRIRYTTIALSDRVVVDGYEFEVIQIRDVGPGRRRTLEIKCRWVGQ